MSLINIVINIIENKVDWNICQGTTRAKCSCFRYDVRSGEMARRRRQRNELSVLVRMPGVVNLIPVAVLGRPVLVSQSP